MQGFVARACGVLTKGHAEVAKLTVEMLIKLCLFSAHSYQLAIQVRAAMLMTMHCKTSGRAVEHYTPTLLARGCAIIDSFTPRRHCLGSVQHHVCQRPALVARLWKQLPCLLQMPIGRLLSQQPLPRKHNCCLTAAGLMPKQRKTKSAQHHFSGESSLLRRPRHCLPAALQLGNQPGQASA